MCFSATASFTAAGVLGVMGTITMVRTRRTKEFPLSTIPIVFAVQQFIEGLLWVSLNNSGAYTLALTYLFLFFAFLWWPIYVPYLAFRLEKPGKRRIILAGFCILGAIVGSILYANFLFYPMPAMVVNQCVLYNSPYEYSTILTYFYVLAVVGVGLVSTQPIIKLFTLLLGSFALVAWLIFLSNFTSVWCFFAAIISLVLCFHHLKRR